MKEIQPKTLIGHLFGKECKPMSFQKFWSDKKWRFEDFQEFFDTFTPAGFLHKDEKKKYNYGSK